MEEIKPPFSENANVDHPVNFMQQRKNPMN